MKYISISTIGEFPEDFLFAKVDVERKLLEDKEIEQRMKLEEFIVYLNIQKTIYMKGQKSIAFRYIEGKDDNYVFYSFLDKVDNKNFFEGFKNKIEKLNFDFSSLKQVEPTDMLEEGFLDKEYIMLDFKMYK